jgi:GDP-L-fucose synthase
MLSQDNIPLNSKILITGGSGLVGSALVAELQNQGYTNLAPLTRQCCDLTNFEEVKSLFSSIKPDVVFHMAASVFGIGGNAKNPAAIFRDNIPMNTHVIEASRHMEVEKVIAMGTVAAYPEPTVLPMKEEHIWNGPPHKSESSYGHAKRAMLAQLLAYQENYGLDFSYAISTNLYGPGDKFDVQKGHVIPSLIRKFYEAKKTNSEVMIWGDGSAARDFLYSKDMARALVLVMNKHSGPINIASGTKTMIKEVVSFLSDYFDMHEKVKWDSSMPNGRQFYEIDLYNLKSIGFSPIYTIQSGLRETLEWFGLKYEEKLIRC